MININANIIPVSRKSGLGWASYWISQMDLLWLGKVIGNQLIDISGNDNHIAITNKDFTGNSIPGSSSSTFQIPNSAGLIANDTDNIWFDLAEANRDVTVSEMNGYDFSRTIVIYSNVAPFNVKGIGLLKSTVALTQTQINLLHRNFKLSIFWSGVLNDFGYVKDNRGFDRMEWTLP
jgi:hypothetical protein